MIDKPNRSIPVRLYWNLLADYLRPQKKMVAALVGLFLTSLVLQLINPQIIRYFIDTATTSDTTLSDPLRNLFIAAILFMSLALIRQLTVVASFYFSENIAWTATNALRADLALHCLKLDLSFHKSNPPGQLIERVDGDVNQLATFFSQLTIQFGGNLLLVVCVLVLLWFQNWRIGLSITIISIIGVFFLNYLNALVIPRWQKVRETDAELFGFLEERLNGTEEIRANGAVGYVMNQLYPILQKRSDTIGAAMNVNSFVIISPMIVFTLSYMAAHWLGSSLFRNSTLTIGGVYVIFNYIDVLREPLWQLLRQVEELQRATASINRIAELRRLSPTIQDGPGVAFPEGALAVYFEEVRFAYEDDAETPVLDGLSFTLQPGTVLGLLGRTGSGKSTLTKLLFRFYDPVNGRLCLGDGAGQKFDIRQATLGQLRQHIGMVTQDVQLFQASVRHNLTLFDPSISDEAIWGVLAEVGLTEWVNGLPQGLDTVLEGGGKALSAGEGQLLAFARVFLMNPRLVILDEASSRLDPATEQKMERAIDRLLAGRTAVIVAHRLQTVQRADEIMILEHGRILEHAPRLELVANPASRFAQLLQTGLEEALAG